MESITTIIQKMILTYANLHKVSYNNQQTLFMQKMVLKKNTSNKYAHKASASTHYDYHVIKMYYRF